MSSVILHTGKRPPAALPPGNTTRVLHQPALRACALSWTAPQVPLPECGLVFYSVEGVRAVADGPGELGCAQLAWAVGHRTAACVEALLGISQVRCPEDQNFQGLLRALGTAALPAHLLSFELSGSPRRLSEHFASAHTTVHSIPCYETLPVEPGTFARLARTHPFDWIVLTSPRGAWALAQDIDLSAYQLAAIGPTTARAIEALGHEVAHVASVPDVDVLIGDVAKLATAQ